MPGAGSRDHCTGSLEGWMIYVARIKIEKKIEIVLAVGDLLVLIFVHASCKRREIKGIVV